MGIEGCITDIKTQNQSHCVVSKVKMRLSMYGVESSRTRPMTLFGCKPLLRTVHFRVHKTTTIAAGYAHVHIWSRI